MLGFFETHIEQGPVLESKNLAVGIVNGISGISRFKLEIEGYASHAGTTPMHLRKDALAATAEVIYTVENIARKNCLLLPLKSFTLPISFKLDLR